jgi:hypothetical protein
LYSSAPKSEGYNREEREFRRGSLGAILWLVGGEVASLVSKGNTPRSCGVTRARHSAVPLGCSVL